jgi:hypothetical protein
MASSMNGLSVGDSVAEDIIVSPVRLEIASCFRYSYLHSPYILSCTLSIKVDMHEKLQLLMVTRWQHNILYFFGGVFNFSCDLRKLIINFICKSK